MERDIQNYLVNELSNFALSKLGADFEISEDDVAVIRERVEKEGLRGALKTGALTKAATEAAKRYAIPKLQEYLASGASHLFSEELGLEMKITGDDISAIQEHLAKEGLSGTLNSRTLVKVATEMAKRSILSELGPEINEQRENIEGQLKKIHLSIEDLSGVKDLVKSKAFKGAAKNLLTKAGGNLVALKTLGIVSKGDVERFAQTGSIKETLLNMNLARIATMAITASATASTGGMAAPLAFAAAGAIDRFVPNITAADIGRKIQEMRKKKTEPEKTVEAPAQEPSKTQAGAPSAAGKTAAKAGETAAKGLQMASKAASAAGKGMSLAGKALMKTKIGAMVGAPLAALGAGAQAAGSAGEAAGAAAQQALRDQQSESARKQALTLQRAQARQQALDATQNEEAQEGQKQQEEDPSLQKADALITGGLLGAGSTAAAADVSTFGISFLLDFPIHLANLGWANLKMIYGTHMAKGKSKVIPPLSWKPIPVPVDPKAILLQVFIVAADVFFGMLVVIFVFGGFCLVHDFIQFTNSPIKVGAALAISGGQGMCLGGIISSVIAGL